MALNNFAAWSTTPSLNIDVGGVSIAEGCAPSGINDAMRNMMAQLKAGVLSISGGTISGTINISGAAGTDRTFVFQTGTSSRWTMLANSTAEGGSNAGSDFGINRHNDAGSAIATSIFISRASGAVTLEGALTIGGILAGPTVLDFTDAVTEKLLMFGAAGSATTYSLGVETGALYHKSPTYHRWYVNANADNGTSAKMELAASGLNVAGTYSVSGNTVIDANRIPRLRTYTVSTLPASIAGGLIFVSDGTSSKRLAVGDGGNWRWPDGAIVS